MSETFFVDVRFFQRELTGSIAYSINGSKIVYNRHGVFFNRSAFFNASPLSANQCLLPPQVRSAYDGRHFLLNGPNNVHTLLCRFFDFSDLLVRTDVDYGCCRSVN